MAVGDDNEEAEEEEDGILVDHNLCRSDLLCKKKKKLHNQLRLKKKKKVNRSKNRLSVWWVFLLMEAENMKVCKKPVS